MEPNWFVNCIYTGGHAGFRTTHQHSLGIHSSRVHIRHTPSPRSWEGKHSGHLDCTHCRQHQRHRRDTLEEERAGRELDIQIKLFTAGFPKGLLWNF